MFSFSSISLFATVALAAFSSAAPVADNTGVAVGAASMARSVEHATCDTACPKSLVDIVIGTTHKVTPIVAKLESLTVADCTVEIVKPIVHDICDVINVAIEEVKVLKGVSIDVALRVDGHVLGLVDFCGLLATLVNLILCAVGVVLRLLVSLKGEVFVLLCLVGTAVSQLLHCIFEVLAVVLVELLVILCPLLTKSFWIIVALRLHDLCVILGIKITL